MAINTFSNSQAEMKSVASGEERGGVEVIFSHDAHISINFDFCHLAP